MQESGVSQVLSVSLKEMKNKNEVKQLGLFDRIKKSLFGKKDEEDENKKEEKQTEQENEAKPESEDNDQESENSRSTRRL